MMRLKIYKCNGQTLIEALITVLFIALSALALIRFQNYLAYDSSISQQRADASLIALQRIENLKSFQTLYTTSGYNAYQDIVSGSQTVTGTTTNYTVTWTVTNFTNPDYKNINVLVSWTDRNGGTQTIRLVTNIAGIEPSNSANII